MSEYHYLLLGGSRHGQKHVDRCHQFSLYFWAGNRLEDSQSNSEIFAVQNERYKVSPEKCADGNWYLVGYCGAKPEIPVEVLTDLILDKNVKPMM